MKSNLQFMSLYIFFLKGVPYLKNSRREYIKDINFMYIIKKQFNI